ncbi:MAG: class I SAM-dependent methyltransferase [Elusimicrobiaceae bacterium]|nr:class I SAM-dependent methyltransferase [Elusimicrobiaceae bacterium]
MNNGTSTDWKQADLAAWYNKNMRGDITNYAALFNFNDKDHLLDLGCGDGTLLALAAQKGAQVTGVDMADVQLELARQKLQGCKNATLLQRTLQEVDFAPNSFTKISMRKAIHHLTNDEKGLLIDKIHHWLTPGGILIIEDMILSFALHRKDEKLPCLDRDAAQFYAGKWPQVRDAVLTTLYKEFPCDLAQLTHHLLFTGFTITRILTPTCFYTTVIAEK